MSFISRKSRSVNIPTTPTKIQIIKAQDLVTLNQNQNKSYVLIESKLAKSLAMVLAIIIFPWFFAGFYLVRELWRNHKAEKQNGRV
tara:strand:+ start:276 stop:533 length:258 start_codon:yes stop_codon:yes gene_type:complete